MRIVHAIHDFLPRHVAGSEIYAFELCRELAKRHDVTVLCAEYDLSRRHGSIVWRSVDGLPVAEIINNWSCRSFVETYAGRPINRALTTILRRTRPDVLHIHNLLNLSFELPALAKARGTACVATLHDYTLVCPSGGQRVHKAEEHVCTEIDTGRCARCFPESSLYRQIAGVSMPPRLRDSSTLIRLTRAAERHAPQLVDALRRTMAPQVAVRVEDIDRRLTQARLVLDALDLVVAPSNSLGHEYLRLGLRAEKLMVADNGFIRFQPSAHASNGRLRIGFVGTLTWHKGAHVVVEALRGLPPDKVELLIFGDPDIFPDYVAGLRANAAGLPVQFMGGFERSRVRDVYAQIDVLVVPSVWPENSPLVIHEAFMAGVPVVGSRIGGIPELVTHEEHGLIFDTGSAADLRVAIRRLIAEPALLSRFRQRLPSVKSIEQDARDWESRYVRVTGRGGVQV